LRETIGERRQTRNSGGDNAIDEDPGRARIGRAGVFADIVDLMHIHVTLAETLAAPIDASIEEDEQAYGRDARGGMKVGDLAGLMLQFWETVRRMKRLTSPNSAMTSNCSPALYDQSPGII
jgi:hypothetical protein